MKLYYAPGTCALAPHIVLEWIGVPYETQQVRLGDPDYLKINPLGTVPVLEADGRLLNQADAILKYLVHRHPEASLGADGTPLGEHDLDRWLAFLTGDFHPAFYPVFTPQRYTTSEAEGDRDAVKDAGLQLVAKFLAHLNAHLADRSHLALDRRTVADPYAFAMLRWARPLTAYPHVDRFFDAMLSDVGVQAAMKAQGID
ncbi:MAG: glutathione S-transferase family protein [Pseudomonadales bacterium]